LRIFAGVVVAGVELLGVGECGQRVEKNCCIAALSDSLSPEVMRAFASPPRTFVSAFSSVFFAAWPRAVAASAGDWNVI